MKTVKLSLVLLLLCGALVFGGTIKDYSADQVDVQSNKVIGKIYATESRLRLEVFSGDGKLESFVIVRQDEKKIYTFQEEDKTYMEFPILGNNVSIYESLISMGQSFGIIPDIKRENQGSETVSGYKTDKFRTTTTVELFGQRQTTTSYEWIAAEFDMPIRIQNEDTTVEMRNIKTAKPAASLFEIPSGYSSLGNMGDLMKALGQ